MQRSPEIVKALEEGIELFNQREFFEAHEIWEEAWADTYGDERHLLQGLIQVAAGFFKLQMGQPAGTYKLLDKGSGHLREIPSDYYGVDLETLLAAVVWWIDYSQELLNSFRTDFDPEKFPRLDFITQ